MATFSLSVYSLVALIITSAAFAILIAREICHRRILALQTEKHLEVEALRNQMRIQMETLYARIEEESKAHMRTIQLLSSSRTPEAVISNLELDPRVIELLRKAMEKGLD